MTAARGAGWNPARPADASTPPAPPAAASPTTWESVMSGGGSLERGEDALGDGDVAEIDAAVLAVKVGAPGLEQTETRGQRLIAADRERAVLRMPDFDAVEPAGGEPLHHRIHQARPGMGEDAHAAGLVDERDGLSCRKCGTGPVCP